MRLLLANIYQKLLQFFSVIKALLFSGWCAEAFWFFVDTIRKKWSFSSYPVFYIWAFSFCGVLVLALVLGFVPDKLTVEVRKPLNTKQVLALKQDVIRPLTNNTSHIRGQFLHDKVLSDIGISSSISRKNLSQFYINTLIVQNAGTSISFDQIIDESMEALISTSKVAFVSSNVLGEPLNFQGLPLRWIQAQKTAGLNLQAIVNGNQYLYKWVKVKDSTKSLFERAGRYKTIVEKYSRRYNLPTELVYAIICAESSCDPAQISNRSAHGLMQIVPKTAGFEVNKWFGLVGLPTSDELLHPETNIKYGTSYLYLLMTRHLNAIKNNVSREYCAIAAYNMGINAMLRTFAETPQDAFVVINSYNAKQLQEHLINHLPSKETRVFLQRVLSFKESFTVLL